MNNIENILQYIDDLIFEQTGANLTPVQETILTGVWQGKTYPQIATDFHCSESYIKKEAAKLWKKLGKSLEDDINSDNFSHKIEKKYRVSSGNNSGYCMQVNEVNGNINICDNSLQTKNKQQRSPSPHSSTKTPIIDLTKAPELNYNYGRNCEISELKEWILENHTRLITIYGLSGIGKTALTLKLISEIKTNFDYIIYRSLNNVPKLITLKDDLKKVFSQSQPTPLPEIIDYFCSYDCLVILDDVHNIFQSGKLSGQYLTEYQDYSDFFKQIATNSHSSCLILISWENSANIETLDGNKQILPLKGLGENAKEILRQKDLKDEEKWDELITLYQGNPTWLNIISSNIKLFDGRVSLFITDEEELVLDNITAKLEGHLQRLSELEKKVIKWFAMQNEPIDICQKPVNLDILPAQFKEVIPSLIRRCLIEKLSNIEGAKFQVNSIFKAYISMLNNS